MSRDGLRPHNEVPRRAERELYAKLFRFMQDVAVVEYALTQAHSTAQTR